MSTPARSQTDLFEPGSTPARRKNGSRRNGGAAPKSGRAPVNGSGRTGNSPSSAVRYDESVIKTLSSLEHIRLRTGMYIGRLGDGSDPDDGIYMLIKEVIDNSVDEFIMGFGKKIEVQIDLESGRAGVRDYGRGIPLGKLVECVSVINTGAKYNDDVFQFSVGLNGVGTKAVNALSEQFRVVSYRGWTVRRGHLSAGPVAQTDEKGQRPR